MLLISITIYQRIQKKSIGDFSLYKLHSYTFSKLRQWVEYSCYTVWISAKIYNTYIGIEPSIMKYVSLF